MNAKVKLLDGKIVEGALVEQTGTWIVVRADDVITTVPWTNVIFATLRPETNEKDHHA